MTEPSRPLEHARGRPIGGGRRYRVRLPGYLVDRLEQAAEHRSIRPDILLETLVYTALDASLIDAVLDDK
jgi:hypothetical protein